MQFNTIDSNKFENEKRWDPSFFLSVGHLDSDFEYPLVKIGDLVKERREFLQPNQYPDRVFNYIGLENIESVTGLLIEFEPKLGTNIRSRSKIYRNGDILYGRLRPTLRKALVVDDYLGEGICSTEIFVLIPKKERILSAVLRVILTSPYVNKIIGGLVGGAALPRIQLEDFLEIKIPCPSIEIQHKLAKFTKNVEAELQKHRFLIENLPIQLHEEIWQFLKKSSTPVLNIQEPVKHIWENHLPKENFQVPARRRRRKAG